MLAAATRLCATRAFAVLLTASIALLPAQVVATAFAAAIRYRIAAAPGSLPTPRTADEREGRLRDSVASGELRSPPAQETRLERVVAAVADLPELKPREILFSALLLLATLPLVAAGIYLALAALTPLALQWQRGGRLGAQECWALLGPRMGAVIGTTLLAAFLSLLGLVLCVLPGLLLLAGFVFAAPVTLLEGHRGVAALRRSLALAQAVLPKLLSVLAVFAVLRAFALGVAAAALPPEALLPRLLLADAICTLLFPLPVAALALLYDEARKREAQDMRRSAAPG